MNQEQSASSEVNDTSAQSKKSLIEQAQLIRIEEVSAITTLAKSSINLWVSQGKFVKPIILSPTVKVWRLRDILSWIDSQASSNGESANA
mgnify:CR=1 FL=1